MLDATHPYTPDEMQKIMGAKSTPLTEEQARELLAAPSGSRPRIYGLLWDNVQLVRVKSHYDLDRLSMSALWLSGTTINDLIRKA